MIAGPNGSGKTTLMRSGVLAQVLPVPAVSINADDFAKALAGGTAPSDAQSLQAAQLADALLDDRIATGHSVIVETVLSSDKFKSRVSDARAAGFQIVLVYVSLRSAEFNVARVANRVALGGHDVPETRIRARRTRSHAMFAWFAEQADQVLVFDNSTASPALGALKGPTGWVLHNLDVLPVELALTIRSLAANKDQPPQT